ncbi:hypothetical protein EJB05_31725, partial [Eragrostis curvula]
MAVALPLVFMAAADGQVGEPCLPVVCGNVNVTFPFGVLPDQATDTNCGGIGLQCLLARRRHPQASILGRLRRGKLPHIPANNSSTKIALPFSISPLNQELIFYNCTGVPVKTVREGLVETRCRNNTFVRAGEHYDEKSSSGSYFLVSRELWRYFRAGAGRIRRGEREQI